MNISYNWLKELLPGLRATPKELAELLTLHSYETVIARSWDIDPAITVVRITKLEPHPNADRLRLATVTDGTQEIRVVCGAPNIQEGHIVPYSPPGATVYDKEGNPFEITEATIRGEKSPGMLNSARELGLGADHGGILVLPEDTSLGDPLNKHILNDTVLDVDVTPNRAHDSFSHLGVAREITALLNLEIQEPAQGKLPEPQQEIAGRSLAIEDSDKTPRYMNIVLSGITNSISPAWMQARLFAAGMRPVNCIADITNYVMLETGNPSHAFDTKRLPGNVMGVRSARTGEKLALLDGTTVEVPQGALLVTSNDTPVALAGIMGGAGAETTKETTDIVLEVATFHGYSIQRAAAKLGMRTEASARFMKGLDPSVVDVAAGRLIALFNEFTGVRIEGVLDAYPRKSVARTISYRPERASGVAGVKIAEEKQQDMLTRLRCTVDTSSMPWQVTVPLERLDLEGEHDIVEEVIRMVGLKQIPPGELEQAEPVRPAHPITRVREIIRDILVEQGMTETYNYSFESAQSPPDKGRAGGSQSQITLANPIAPEQRSLRASLLSGLLANAATNKEDFHKKFSKQEKALFEIGHVYEPGEGVVSGVYEEERVAGMLVGSKEDVANIVQELLDRLQVERTDEIVVAEHEVAPEVLKTLKYRVPLAYFEINLTELVKHIPESFDAPVIELPAQPVQYTPFSRFPSVLRDVSFLVDASVSVDQAQNMIERVGGELVVDTDLFDEFKPAGQEKKGLAFHIEYQARDRTLTDEEVNQVHGAIIGALKGELGAEIR